MNPEGLQASRLRFVRGAAGKFERIRFGQESDYNRLSSQDGCHDCGVEPGELHAPMCDMEVCPNCAGQLFSCECDLEFGAR